AVAPVREHHPGPQCALHRRAWEVVSARPCAKSRNMQALAEGTIPIGRVRGVLKRNPPVGKVLRESAPRSEIQLFRLLQLRQVSFEPRPFSQQAEDSPLVENVYLVLPDHIVDGRQFTAVAHECGSEAGKAVSHQLTSCGRGMASAKPARKTECENP